MCKDKKRKSVFIVFLLLIALAVSGTAVLADELPSIDLPGQDLVADGTTDEEQAQAPAQTTAPASSRPVSSRPDTAEHTDFVPYFIILGLALAGALVYRQVIIIDRRNDAREEHEAEMEKFRDECKSARISG